ncbi:methyltransferase domain-containing protein [bacterium]|nr:methyltransferase domain-containing protein [bacterium]MCP5463205.1 methyltransferase domain-containing protein [bacterium]
MKNILTRERIDLFVISSLGLFLQMACIRWLPSQIRVLAYYTNIVMLASFLGLGVGYMLADRKIKLFYGFPCIFGLLITLAWLFSKNSIEVVHSDTIYIWQTIISPLTHIDIKWILAIIFLVMTALFIPIGQQTGSLFDKMEPVSAYTTNIFGSVFGILFYSVLSYNLLPPVWLFAIFVVMYLYFFYKRSSRSIFLAATILLVFFLGWIASIDTGSFWSPYYKIEISKLPHSTISEGFNLTVNNDYHQMALNLSDDRTEASRGLKEWARLYELPYRVHPDVQNALIVGAGTGNDVAGALRMNVAHIDAVDIDPLIFKIGRRYHPEQPYDSERVTRIVDDARSYFKKTDKKYDAIVFGFLDSHQLFSSMSAIRLDTYVYTVESIREAKRLLKPGGIISLTFCVTKDWIGRRLLKIMEEATGQTPLLVSSGDEPNGFTFIYGRQVLPSDDYKILNPNIFGDMPIEPSIDDWPFFYLKEKTIPSDYYIVMFIVLLISLGLVFVVRRGSITDFSPVFFFLGAGFLLFETKSLTHLSLLFGSTWIVNSAVFTAIFITILCANLYYAKVRPSKTTLYYGLLFSALLVHYCFPLEKILLFNFWIKAFVAGILIGLPVFFSGVIFITKFSQCGHRSAAMGANLLGAMMGGVLEYSSLLFGFKNLIFLIALFYMLSMIKVTVKK